MAKVTWLGEDTKDAPGPDFNIWGKYTFPKGKAVEVVDEHILAQARQNHFYKVVESKPAEPAHAKTPEAKTEAAVEAKAQEGKPGQKDPRDYPPVKKAPKKQVRKPKPAAHAHR